MGGRLKDGTHLQCSTCHDQHQADTFSLAARGPRHIKPPVRSGGTGAGVITVTSAPGNLPPTKYVLTFTTGGAAGTAVFDVTILKDQGVTLTETGVQTTGGTAQVGLTDPDGAVSLAFSDTFDQNAEYSFFVSYPFLRADNTDAKMCTTCHKARHMSWQNVEGQGTVTGTQQPVQVGTTVFSHPVGVGQTLNANDARGTGLRNYDRTVPLDANGAIQPGTLDGDDGAGPVTNSTNDLVLGTGGIVTCLTCHQVHNADSNSLSVDKR